MVDDAFVYSKLIVLGSYLADTMLGAWSPFKVFGLRCSILLVWLWEHFGLDIWFDFLVAFTLLTAFWILVVWFVFSFFHLKTVEGILGFALFCLGFVCF